MFIRVSARENHELRDFIAHQRDHYGDTMYVWDSGSNEGEVWAHLLITDASYDALWNKMFMEKRMSWDDYIAKTDVAIHWEPDAFRRELWQYHEGWEGE